MIKFKDIQLNTVYKFSNVRANHKTHDVLYGIVEIKERNYLNYSIGVRFEDLGRNIYDSSDGLYWYYSYAKNGAFDFMELEDLKIIDEEEEENKMSDILEIYKDKQVKRIKRDYDKKMKKSVESNEEYNSVLKMCEKYGIDMPATEKFDTVKQGLYNLDREQDLEIAKLHETIGEIKAQLELCENYDQKIAVLTNYNVLDENGKVKGD